MTILYIILALLILAAFIFAPVVMFSLLGGVLLLIALICFLNVKCYIEMADEFTLRAGVGPIIIKLMPKKEKKVKTPRLRDFTYEKHQKRLKKEQLKAEKKAQKKKAKQDKKNKLKEASDAANAAAESKKSTAKDKIATVVDIIKLIFDLFPRAVGAIKLDIRRFNAVIGDPDPAKSAIEYGAANAVVGAFIETVRSELAFTNVKLRQARVDCDFTLEKPWVEIDVRIKIRIFDLVKIGLRALIWLIKKKIKG